MFRSCPKIVGFYCLTSVGISLAKAPWGLGFVLLLNPWMAFIPFSLHYPNLIHSYLNMEVDGKYAMRLMVELQWDPCKIIMHYHHMCWILCTM